MQSNNHSQSSKMYTADRKEKRQIVIKIIHCLQRGRSLVRTGHLRWIDLLTITNFEDEIKNIRHFSFANEFKYQSRVMIAHEERVEICLARYKSILKEAEMDAKFENIYYQQPLL